MKKVQLTVRQTIQGMKIKIPKYLVAILTILSWTTRRLRKEFLSNKISLPPMLACCKLKRNRATFDHLAGSQILQKMF